MSEQVLHKIGKRPGSGLAPNMADYDHARAQFSWSAARAELAGLRGGRLNIAHEAVDRHLAGPVAGTAALRFLGKRGGMRQLTYKELARETDRFANVLRALAVERRTYSRAVRPQWGVVVAIAADEGRKFARTAELARPEVLCVPRQTRVQPRWTISSPTRCSW
jgi:hypothetical protein